jgi:hypothetical protein
MGLGVPKEPLPLEGAIDLGLNIHIRKTGCPPELLPCFGSSGSSRVPKLLELLHPFSLMA